MTPATPVLAHLAEALRAHRLHVGAGRVPAALIGIESELLVALGGIGYAAPEPAQTIGHRDRVLVTAAQCAEMLSLSPRKVRDLRSSGRLPAVVVDRCVRFSVADLVEFAENHREGQ